MAGAGRPAPTIHGRQHEYLYQPLLFRGGWHLRAVSIPLPDRWNTQYDALGGIGGVNRSVVVPNLASTNVGPVFWNDASPADYLDQDTLVTFSVSMTNAQQYPSGPAFVLGTDQVYVNGDFTGWLAWNPISLASYQLATNLSNAEVYYYSQVFLQGRGRSLTYKYAINGADNEAAPFQNHFRFIRSTNGVYNLPLDIFGVQYNEPKVGGLTIGSPSGGSVRSPGWLIRCQPANQHQSG